MSRTLKESLLYLGTGMLSSFGLPRLLQSCLYSKQLAILMYHAVIRDPLEVPDWCFLDEQSFSRQIDYVKRHFRVVALSEAVRLMTSGSLNGPTLVITFDDGYQNNYEVAFPILAHYECPATIFLTTSYVDSDQIPAFCRLNLALGLTTKRSLMWDGASYDLLSAEQKERAGIALRQSLKTHHPYAIDGLVANMCRLLEVDPDRRFDSASPYHILRRDSIQRMVGSGLVNFGGHTHNHTILSRLSDTERREEISGSIQRVQSLTGQTCDSFAYPNGSREDYDRSSIELLKSAGVSTAVSTISGPNTVDTPLMELRRYGIGPDVNFARFTSTVHHVTHRMRQLGSPSKYGPA
jgi:peptidoglycan/xylan/chitin deacetylase (PgdA/CDA1 family)